MKKIQIEIKWGILFVLMGLVWMVLERVAGLHDVYIEQHPVYTNLFAIPAIALYVFALLEKRKKDYGGIMNYKQGVISGLWITLVVTIFSPLSMYLTATIITPDFFTNAIEASVRLGEMSREEAEAYFSLKNYTIQSVMFAPVMGIVTSLIVAFFTKKENA